MKKDSKKGFTLTELTVVLVILGIVAAIAVPFALRYIKLAEFRKNEANAKTVYLAAESELTWYRTSGKWKEFRKEVIGKGERNDTFSDAEKKERIYAISLNSDLAEQNSESEKLVRKLLEDNAYDKDFLNAAITIEIDVETGHVYSAFYATRCKSLAYEGADDKDILNISAAGDNRAYENRRDRLLGYYSTEDVTNVVELKPIRLKVTTINLVNSETLALNWSSNSRHDNLDVEFGITFYEKNKKEKLFSVTVNRDELIKSGHGPNSIAAAVPLSLKDKDGNSIGEWAFPLTYQESEGRSSRFSLTLDGMMSADLMESLEAAETGDIDKAYSTSITRLGEAASLLKEPQNIYAEVEVSPTYQNMGKDAREYRKSSPVTSNTENTMFADAPEEKNGKQEVEISRFRHLSNIRYYKQNEETVFALTGRNMDWTSEGTGLFTAQVREDASGAGSMRQLQWKSTKQGDVVLDFPSIRLLSKKYILDGGATAVSRMRLGADSVPSDEEINKFYSNGGERQQHYAEYLGLFCEVEGKIWNLTLKDPTLSLAKGEKGLDFLVGVGLVCGRSEGQLRNVRVEVSAGEDADTVEAYLADRAGADRPAAVGGLIGIVAKKDASGKLSALEPVQAGSTADNSVLKDLQMEGAVNGTLPEMRWTDGNEEDEKEQQQAAVSYQYGIGGIFGYASVKGGAKIEGCINHAKIEGNLFAGGIGGRLDGGYRSSGQTNSGSRDPNMENCSNDGLVLCTSDSVGTAQTLNGRYFGGIVGYGMGMCIEDSSSASGRSDNYRYDVSKRDSLAGKYVGGIIGHGEDSRLVGCSTKKGGYILGAEHVGGIAGSLSSDVKDVIQGAQKGVAATVNASYVIGNRYVGGIVGENGGGDTNSTVYNCINNGVVAGYEYYIGGIAGYNGSKGTLENCASYLSDYDHSVFRMVRDDWKAVEGDCVGGLAGYNNGTIRLTEDNNALTVKSVSSIVTGNNFVGGMIGFNDTEGNLDLADEYTLIGGQVEAAGSAVGGCIGLNASVKILGNTLEVKPSGVNGKYCVGGCIGANVVALTEDMEASGLQANNTLGKITGSAFTGGVIGYQRTYAGSQLGGGKIKILEYLSITHGNDALKALAVKNAGSEAGTAGFAPMLPKVNEANNIPTVVMESANQNCLTISLTGNTAGELTQVNNNVPIQSYLYSGGVVGYCERGSRLVLLNCKNAGDISKPDGEDGLAAGVSLKAYLTEEGMDSAAAEIEDVNVSMVGGVASSNGVNQVIDHCANAGSMSGFVGLGGIVSFNTGGVFDCELSDNFGNAGLDYIGGIAGLNVNAFVGASGRGNDLGTEYTYNNIKYRSGTIRDCSTGAGKSIVGRSYVGGIAGYNLSGGTLEKNSNNADVTASGNYAGGIAGSNKGSILLTEDKSKVSRAVNGRSGIGIGGIAGINKAGGTIAVSAEGEEVIVVNGSVSIVGNMKVGGIVGINEGILEVRSAAVMAVRPYLTCEASEVRALAGHAGGIAGEARGDITKARNKCGTVTANFGPAGGITAVNMEGIRLISCQNLGNVNSDYGHAGGIVAENYGTIRECKVETSQGQNVRIQSRGTDEIGAVCAENEASARIEGCTVGEGVILSGESSVIGGIAGRNFGMITASDNVKKSPGVMPQVNVSAARLTVGGAAGRNESGAGSVGMITNLQVSDLTFDGVSNYRYLGGIVGENSSGAGVSNCSLSDVTIREAGSAAGNCYGGIAGKNGGRLENCEVGGITCIVQGIYTAVSTSTAEQKESQASHVGGVAGKNEETGVIMECRIVKGSSTNIISAESGMAGGIAGYNNGNIQLSGDGSAIEVMRDSNGALVSDGQMLTEQARQKGISKDSTYVGWNGKIDSPLEELSYNGGNKLNSGRDLQLTMSVNGNIGGITAYNSPKASVDYCATGNWYISNKSEAIGVGTGGIIGMNESEKDQSFLLNQAFVGREIEGKNNSEVKDNKGGTNRFAGGIIGNQNNTTAGGWKLKSCANYGTIYCLRTHYSGGVIGQWTGTGGTVEDSYNYGNLQTTYVEGWVGAAAGIVAQLYHAYEGNEYNIIGCGNFGNIYGRTGESYEHSANDSGGILGNVTAYSSQTNTGNQRQNYKIQVLDCVNGPGVKIYSYSMASGIVGFLSSDSYTVSGQEANLIGEDTKNIELRIERCRNYASVLNGRQFVAGIFGDRYGETGARNTVLEDCFSVNRQSSYYNKANYPIVSMLTANSMYGKVNNNKAGIYNYFLSDNTRDSFILLSGNRVQATQLTAGENPLDRVNTGCAYFLTKNGKQYLIYLDSSKIKNAFRENDLQISSGRVTLNKQEVGEVIFEIENDQYNALAAIVEAGSSFDEHVKKYYIQKETGGKEQMPAPEKVELSWADNNKEKIQIKVTPSANTDPYKYTAVLYRSDKIGDGEEWKPVGEEFEFFAEDYSYTLPKEISDLGGYLKVGVRAYSSDKTTAPSDEKISENHIGLGRVLPAPEIRIELRKGGGTNQYQYQCHLVNMEDYAEFKDASGNNTYKISVQSTDSTVNTEMEVDENGNMSPSLATGKTALQQLIVQAEPKAENMDIRESVPATVPVYLPTYKPEISLGAIGGNQADKNMIALPGVSITGESLEDLRITVTLTTNGKSETNKEMSVTTPPIYRADLIGTWDGRENTVFDSIDMLTAANGTISASFANLPEELAEVSDLKVRIWYSRSGLGPVYTYYPVKDLNPGALNGYIYTYPEEKLNEIETGRTDVAEGQEMEWRYAFSHVLADTDFAKYRWNSSALFDWLPRPNLSDDTLTPEYDGNNRLQYMFRWDQGAGEYQPGQKYMISLAGINENEDGTFQKVSIVTNMEISDNQYTADAEEWTYKKVELTVTRIGDTSGDKKTVGLTASKEYSVKQRLPRPAQPSAVNYNTDELVYTIEWAPVTPEIGAEPSDPQSGCVSYGIYVQPYEADGTTLGAPELLETVPAGEKQPNGMYRKDLNLEKYAGKRAMIYVVAQAREEDVSYVNSVNGVTYELDIPARINAPQVTWAQDWEYDPDKFVSVEEFEAEDELKAGRLRVTVILDKGSIPPGDSSYLLKAYVFNSEDEANAAKTSIENGGIPEVGSGGLLATCPAMTENILPPNVMEINKDGSYSATLRGISSEYAGKWLLLYTRISAGGGQISSNGAVNPDIWRLPYVQLPKPTTLVEDDHVQDIVVKAGTNPDMLGEENWTARQTGLCWDGVKLADTYYVRLKNKDGTETEYRFVEEADPTAVLTGEKKIVVYQKKKDGQDQDVWEEVTMSENPGITGPEIYSHQVFELLDYNMTYTGNYTEDGGLIYTYQVELNARLETEWSEEKGFTYRLILPDAVSLTSAKGTSVTDSGLRVTAEASVSSDVAENTPDGASQSDAYRRSEEDQVLF